MVRQIGIELVGDLPQLGQARPGDGGEVVVLVVQADVVGEEVERAVVAERLGDGQVVGRVAGLRGHLLVDVVLGDEVAGGRVQGSGEEGREEQVEDRVEREEPGQLGGQDVVEAELDGHVERVDARQGDLVDHHGPQGVEEDLEGAEEGLAQDGVEEDGLEGGRQVGVEAIDAEGLVVR